MQGVSCISGQEGRKPVCELDKIRESGQISSLSLRLGLRERGWVY